MYDTCRELKTRTSIQSRTRTRTSIQPRDSRNAHFIKLPNGRIVKSLLERKLAYRQFGITEDESK